MGSTVKFPTRLELDVDEDDLIDVAGEVVAAENRSKGVKGLRKRTGQLNASITYNSRNNTVEAQGDRTDSDSSNRTVLRSQVNKRRATLRFEGAVEKKAVEAVEKELGVRVGLKARYRTFR